MKGVKQRSCIILTAQNLFITWKGWTLHQWEFDMSFASINYARPPVALRKHCLTFVEYYLYFKILCRLKEVSSYIVDYFLYFKENNEIRVFILLHCDVKCADNINWQYQCYFFQKRIKNTGFWPGFWKNNLEIATPPSLFDHFTWKFGQRYFSRMQKILWKRIF